MEALSNDTMSNSEKMFFDRLADALLQRTGSVQLRNDDQWASAAYWAMMNSSVASPMSFASAVPFASAFPMSANYIDAFASATAARVMERLQGAGGYASTPSTSTNEPGLPVCKDTPVPCES
jgi:hypothetical protein